MAGSPEPSPDAETFETEGSATLFGYDARTVQVRVRPRPRRWRLGGAARIFGAALLLAPLVTVVPPHAPWLIGALAIGGILARRRWTERFTVESVRGPCPKCGEELRARKGRLRRPHPLPCEACHHESALAIPEAALEAHRTETE